MRLNTLARHSVVCAPLTLMMRASPQANIRNRMPRAVAPSTPLISTVGLASSCVAEMCAAAAAAAA